MSLPVSWRRLPSFPTSRFFDRQDLPSLSWGGSCPRDIIWIMTHRRSGSISPCPVASKILAAYIQRHWPWLPPCFACKCPQRNGALQVVYFHSLLSSLRLTDCRVYWRVSVVSFLPPCGVESPLSSFCAYSWKFRVKKWSNMPLVSACRTTIAVRGYEIKTIDIQIILLSMALPEIP